MARKGRSLKLISNSEAGDDSADMTATYDSRSDIRRRRPQQAERLTAMITQRRLNEVQAGEKMLKRAGLRGDTTVGNLA